MADMELVIKIPEELLEYFANHNCMHEDGWFSHSSILLDAFRNGTPLPKDHGRLFDADAIMREEWEKADRTNNYFACEEAEIVQTVLSNASTVIEADTGRK